MALWTIHAHSVHFKYKANLCSKATIFVLFCGILTILLPFLIVYRNYGFWGKIGFYQEQPNIHFKNKLIIIIEGKNYNCHNGVTESEAIISGPSTMHNIETSVKQQTKNYYSENIEQTTLNTDTYVHENLENTTIPFDKQSSSNLIDSTVFEEHSTESTSNFSETVVDEKIIKRFVRETDTEIKQDHSAKNLKIPKTFSDSITSPDNSKAYVKGFKRQSKTYESYHDQKLNNRHCSTVITWSTLFTYNHLYYDHLRSATLTSREDDLNRDGRNDVLHFTVKLPLKDTEEIFSVKALLAFDYQLLMINKLYMESLAYIAFNSGLSGYKLTVIGDLVMKQRKPFKYMEKNLKISEPIIPENSLDINDYNIGQIFTSYSQRNATTRLENIYTVWSSGTDQYFQLKGAIFYPEDEIKYIPGISEIFKWAWIQYLAFLTVFYLIFRRVKTFVLKNNMVPSVQFTPWKIHDA